MFRAVNMIGAVANMVHLLYSEMDYAAKHIAKYAMPKKLEFRESLPKTLIDKVAYRQLVEEKTAKRKAAGE